MRCSSSPTTSCGSTPSPATTDWAASSVNGDANTPRRRNTDAGRVGEQRVAPLDRALDGLVALVDGPRAAAEHAQRVGEPGEELGRRQHPAASRRQLDGQRDAVQLGADAHDVRHVLVREAEVASGSGRAIDEQADRVAARDGLEGRAHLRREPERWHPPAQLTRHVQRRAARGQDRDLGAAAQDLRRHLGARVGQVLAVVQDEQHPLSRPAAARPRPGDRRGPRRAGRRG